MTARKCWIVVVLRGMTVAELQWRGLVQKGEEWDWDGCRGQGAANFQGERGW